MQKKLSPVRIELDHVFILSFMLIRSGILDNRSAPRIGK